MRPPLWAGALVLAATLVLALPSPATAGSARVAALQSALDALGLYAGTVDGVRGPLTRRGIVAFQRRHALAADGIAGPRTRHALGWRGRPRLGARAIRQGDRGWDVAALQYLLQRAGRGPGRADGVFGPLTAAAVLRAQRGAGLAVDGVAGPATLSALRGASRRVATRPVAAPGPPSGPVAFLRPVWGPIGDGFGARRAGGRRHQGLDFPVAHGTRVGAAGVGTTIFAGYNSAGYGNLVVVQHRLGWTTWYAHLSRIATWVGEAVSGGTRLGYVGSTGYSTGPHLHFETRRYNTPVDPRARLLTTVAARIAGPPAPAPPTAPRRGAADPPAPATAAASARAVRDECARRPPRSSRRHGPWIAREPLCGR